MTTPLISKCIRAAANWRGDWDQQRSAIKSPRGLVQAIQGSAIFQVDEAEWDTTALRRRHPERFQTGEHVYLPDEPCWIEYKAYGPNSHFTGCRSAFLAVYMPNGDIRVMTVSDGPFPNGIFAMHAFDLDAAVVRNKDRLEGRHFMIGTNLPDGDRAGAAANFFMELLVALNWPEMLKATTEQPSAAAMRRLKAEFGAKETLPPYTTITLAKPTSREAQLAGIY